jgi:hypothetical protein
MNLFDEDEQHAVIDDLKNANSARLEEIGAAADDLAQELDGGIVEAQQITAAIKDRSMSVADAEAALAALRRSADRWSLVGKSLSGSETGAARLAEDPSYLLSKYDYTAIEHR